MNDNAKLESIIEDHAAEVEAVIEDEVPEDLAAEMYMQHLAEAVEQRKQR